MNIILLGPPGAGKGTQAENITKEFGLAHVSTGDLFRMNLKNETPLGLKAKAYMDEGKLVPDDVTIEMLLDRIAQDDCKSGYMLDGFPRTIPQADALGETGQKIDAALALMVDREKLLDRITGRRVCRNCQAAYHITTTPPAKEGICDKCGGEIYQRDDDNPETAAKRFDVYAESTAPLLEYYAARGILVTVNGDQTMEAVAADISKALKERS